MPNPTIVLASLDDEKLKQSIANLVAHVKRATHTMLTDTNSTVGAMEEKLKSLGNLKIDSKGSADGGASKRTKAQNAETDAVEKTIAARDKQIKKNQEAATSYDQMAAAIQKASRMPSEMRPEKPETRARDSYYAFVAGLKEQRDSLAKVINDFERGLNNAISKRTNEINNQITASKNKIQELNQELNRANATRNEARASQVQGHLDKELRHYKDLESQLKNVNNEFGTSKISLAAMNAEHHRLANLMREETQVQQQQAQTTQQQITEEQRRTEEIRKQAAAIRATKEWQEKGFASVNGKVFYDSERVKGTKQHIREIGTLEEQILRSMQQQSIAERANTQEAQQRLDTIKRIAAEARAEMKQYGTSYHYTGYAVQNPFVYAENDARAKGLTIEQQIEQILKEQTKEYERQAEKIQQTTQKREKSAAQGVEKSFKATLAQTLGVNADEINSTGTSIKNLTAYSKQLQQAWEKLSSAGRHSPFGKQLQEELQLTQLQLQRVRNEASKPISLNFVKGMPEKTLDDIAYKIRQLQSYKMGIDITKPNAQNEIKQVDEAINKLQKDMNKYMNTSKSVIEQNNALGRSWNYMKNRLAFYFTIGAGTQFIKNLIEIRSQYEMNERTLGILIGSAERGTQIFQELSQMSLVSPYTLIELSTAAKQLSAYDVAARDVVDTTRRLADMAAAVGIPIERLTYALGQIKAYGYLNSRDARMFSNAGIPLVKQLSEYYTELEGHLVSTADVYDRIKKKTIDYNDVMKVMYKMTDEGGKFFDFQAKMADTLKVRLANLTLAWNNMLNDIGQSTQGFLTWSIGALRELFLRWMDINRAVNSLVISFGIAKGVQLLYYTAIRGSMLFTQRFAERAIALEKVLGVRLAGAIKAVGKSLTTVMASPLTWWVMLAFAVTSAGMAFYEANQKVKEFNNSIKEGAKENYNNIVEYMKMSQSLRNSLYDTSESAKKQANGGNLPTRDIDKSEAEKAWEEMRNQIEISTNASKEFLGTLISIEDVNERLRVGFALLDDIQKANAALKEMDEKSLSVSQDKSGWWNFYLLPDGLIQNVKDYQTAIEGAEFSWERFFQGFWRQANIIGTAYNIFSAGASDTEAHYKRMKADIDEATKSLEMFLYNQNLLSNPAAISEGYAQLVAKLSVGLNPQEAFELQKAVEESRSNIMRKALEDRIADENAALAQARDENAKKDIQSRLNVLLEQKAMFAQELDHSRPYWDNYTKFLKERYMSEMQQMFGNMTQEEISHINFSEGKYAEFIKKTTDNFVKSHKLSYLEAFTYLRQWVLNANAWSIFIPITFGTNTQKSYYDELTNWDTKADASYNKQKRLREDINRLEKEGKKNTEEYANATKEEAQAQKDYNEAVEHGGKSKAAEASAKKAAASARKSAAAATRAQRQAESELQKAFKDELQLIDKLRSQYKKLTDAGVASGEALNMVTNQFSNSIEHINKVLGKNGLPLFDIKAFVGTSNPRMLLDLLQAQLDAAKTAKNVKPSEIKELELKISELRVDVKAYDTKKIVDGLNNELDKLKDEYELAVALDADPELGSLFTEMFKIDTSGFPRTLQQMVEKTQDEVSKSINKVAKASGGKLGDFNIVNGNLEKWAEQNNIDITSDLYGKLKSAQEQIRKLIRSNFEETSKSWDKLLEKYAEYQYKQTKIAKEANQERLAFVKKFGEPEEIASATTLVAQIETEKDSEKKEILKQQLKNLIASISEDNKLLIQVSLAIDERELREQAKLSFEEFQKTPEWILATGELSEMSYRAINTLIEKIQDYRREAKNLSPKQIKDINKALRDLYKEQRKDNPFASIGNMIDRAKDRMSVYDEEIKKVEKQIDEATFSMESFLNPDGEVDEDYLSNLIKKWQQLKKEQEEAGEIDPSDLVAAINATVKAVQVSIGVFNDLAKAIDGVDSNEADKIFSVLDKAGETAAIGAQIGGAYGAIVGAIVGAGTALVSIFATLRNEEITEQVEASERAVKRLENVYKSLEHTATNAYGAIESGAKRALRSNKELQLAQLERQLQLEESRDSKDQDEDKIIDLRGQINELRNDIKDVSKDIVNDLLGISSAGDGIEGMVSSMIDAFRNGEDVMKAFGDSFDEMVDNMILKLVVTQFMQKAWDNLLKNMENKEEQMLKQYADTQEQAQAHYDDVRNYSDEELRKIIANERYGFAYGLNYSALDKVSQEEIDAYRKAAEEALTNSTDALNNASLEYTKWSLDYMNTEGRDYLTQYATMLKDSLGQWYTYGENKELELSSLRQGISGITEDTANALEAYMNIVSQRVFYNGTLLEQIRDAVVGMDMDVQMATQAQMLLQLQQSYQVQMSIQGILQGVLTPSGRAFSVELLS